MSECPGYQSGLRCDFILDSDDDPLPQCITVFDFHGCYRYQRHRAELAEAKVKRVEALIVQMLEALEAIEGMCRRCERLDIVPDCSEEHCPIPPGALEKVHAAIAKAKGGGE